MMSKTWPLCTGAESDLGERVLGEVEKNSFVALPGFIATVQGQVCWLYRMSARPALF